MHIWQMQEAKSRLSEVVKEAERDGPQEITVHGRSVAVVLSRADYDRLAGTGESLASFIRRSPLVGADDLDFTRDPSLTRETRL
ncbi:MULTISPECIES: type II toxin-antitoxin system Phd/YefM family antitoxin [Thiomonas]|jgi:prevent-host-death family protein|uniref:type II toxin-antitoxin system Phd/YefM family antitoxin n=1 Tax=Thiomonas TaxID=32012 RepID=UPI001ACC610D|nr:MULTISPECIES: type II toxin-antitoxin system Phd/YefM family antitoxin [Thiomonas]MBN8777723.1 type II toxin-antitoxin system Phd/YefM family antitoxin [Thiomonas arsenitoxydans]MDE2269963.1 type II toxin-antitoxin system Phd/YefM family antitoxin [Betaproteobacteria bacterium]HML82078.1 type II toxin-antitoxin system Phd/YefM family antitoxin [Thiomonas arsenitoxydans]